MPTPKKGETQSKFIARCVPVVLAEDDTKNQAHAVAKCYGMWKQSKKKKRR